MSEPTHRTATLTIDIPGNEDAASVVDRINRAIKQALADPTHADGAPAERTEKDTGIYKQVDVRSGPDWRSQKEVLREYAESHERSRNWLEHFSGDAQAYLDNMTGRAPDEALGDARRIIELCAQASAARDAGDVAEAMRLAFHLGQCHERLSVRPFEPYAKYAREFLYTVNGVTLKVSDLERRILEFVDGKQQVDLADFYRAVWGQRYSKAKRNNIKQALSVLTARLHDAGAPIHIGLSRKDADLIVIA